MKLAGSRIDPTGPVYYDGNSYLRHLAPTEEPVVREMFSSGFIAALIAKGLCPKFVEGNVDLQFPDYIAGTRIVRSPELKPAIAPEEWSFLMAKKAALTFLEIVLIAEQYGFTLRDAHAYNFIFTGNRPIWIDLGSFCKKQGDIPHPWFQEFFTRFVVPLEIWAVHPSIAHGILSCSISITFKKSVRLLFFSCQSNSFFARMVGNLVAKFLSIDNYKGRGILHRILKAIFKKDTAKRVTQLRKKIHPLRCLASSSWMSYHDDFLVGGKVPERLPARFERIFSLVSEKNPQSILELAGNAGVFSETIARRLPHIPVICTDYDQYAIDALFSRQVSCESSNLSFAVLDFMQPNLYVHAKMPYHRFQSDCVLALAVTHHLSLSQGFTFDEIFDTIKKYSSRVVFIEFRPLGLYNGTLAPETPEWYTETQFRISFERFFTIDHVVPLEENRILFCGTVIRE